MDDLRACYFCSLIKTFHDFLSEGCENCRFIRGENREDAMRDCTTSNFSGYVGHAKGVMVYIRELIYFFIIIFGGIV